MQVGVASGYEYKLKLVNMLGFHLNDIHCCSSTFTHCVSDNASSAPYYNQRSIFPTMFYNVILWLDIAQLLQSLLSR